MDIVEFLRARLDERVERAKTGALIYTVDRESLETVAVTHEYRHDVIRDVEADRQIIAAYENDYEQNRDLYGGCGDDCEWKALDWVLRVRATRFDEHPDYHPEWRP